MPNLLANKIIVITGGAGRIGLAFVRAVIESGGVAIVADHDSDAQKKIGWALPNLNFQQLDCLNVDINDLDSVQKLLTFGHEKYGRIDALVNNAYPHNKNYGRKLEDVTYEDFCENISLHLGGYFLVMQQFCSYFKKVGGGNIINMSSIYGLVPPRFEIYDGTSMTIPVEYAAIKSALLHLTKYYASYYMRHKNRFNCISPGGILDHQPMTFLKKYNSYASSKGMLNADDLQGALIFLLSDMSKYVNGQNIVIDDGWCL